MPIFSCHCDICGIDFISHKSQRRLCNMCSTKGKETKKLVCKKCGKVFSVGRNPKDENNFYKKTLCPDCSSYHCRICNKCISYEDSIKYNRYCENCRKEEKSVKEDNNIYIPLKHYCTKCGVEIHAELVPGTTNRYLPKGKKRKLCDKCYDEFLKETKTLVCECCGKNFEVGRSKTDCEFLLRKFCTECYNKKYRPEFKLKICKRCGKEFKIYPNNDGRFTEHKQYCETCLPLALKEEHNKTCLRKYGISYSCLLPQCQKAQGKRESNINKKFIKLLNDNGITTESEWYDETNHRHYDIYLPKQDILIEINPSYTHSVLGSHYNGFNVDEEKMKWIHYYRTKDINKRVIHIWDWDDWNKIIQLFKPKQKLYARELKLNLVSEQEAKEFLDIYHIQNNCRGKEINLGLYKNDQLVQLMVFGKPRYNKNYQWELLRLCSHADYIVTGGSEKLFKHFIDNYNPESTISYCDVSKFTGDVYSKLGFKFDKQTAPNKHWSKGKEQITDNLLRQRGFDQLFKTNYGKGTSNEELMIKYGWLPVYDCGQKVFAWNKMKTLL